jgi:hypothetical protein
VTTNDETPVLNLQTKKRGTKNEQKMKPRTFCQSKKRIYSSKQFFLNDTASSPKQNLILHNMLHLHKFLSIFLEDSLRIDKSSK